MVDSLIKKLCNIKIEYVIALTFSEFNRNGLRNTWQRLASIPKHLRNSFCAGITVVENDFDAT